MSALTLKKAPIISYIHCNPNFIKTWNLLSYIYYKLSRKFKKIVFVSNEAADSTVFYQKLKSKIKVIENVVNAKKVQELSILKNTKQYDLLFVGRLIDLKQPLLIIDIIHELDDKNIKCCIVGDGILYNECQKKIEEYGLNKNIDLVGFKSNPYPYMKNSKILLMPSLHEGLPLTCIEAMILNTIVLNSGNGGLSNVFSKNKNLICKTKYEYKEKIKYYLTNEQNLLKQQEECYNLSKKYTDIKTWIKKIENVLEDKS